MLGRARAETPFLTFAKLGFFIIFLRNSSPAPPLIGDGLSALPASFRDGLVYLAGSCFFIASRRESIDSGVVSEWEAGRAIEEGRSDLRRFVAVGVDPGAPMTLDAARGVQGGRRDMAVS